MKARLRSTLFASLIGAVLCTASCTAAPKLHGTALQGLAPDFALPDGSPRPVRLSAERGRTVLLFFGYTHCPDICPTTLSVFAQAKKRLGPAGARVTAIFVSVDPRRDSPTATDAYAKRFDPQFHGVSAADAVLAPVKKAYHIYSQPLPPTAPDTYAVAHSSSAYIVDASGRLRELVSWNIRVDDLVADLRQLIAQ